MKWLTKEEGFKKINTLGEKKIPFLFIISYDKSKIFAHPLRDLDKEILYKVEKIQNYQTTTHHKSYHFSKKAIDFERYQKAFKDVIAHIKAGDTYLLNLTFKTPIQTNHTLKEIFFDSKAKFKLYFQDEFICFSPERFIEIEENTIATYPMKGTIDANIPFAKEKILANEKEMAEHVMIVDLMRNDLGMIGKHIKVASFRHIEKIKAGEKELFQVSSKITAKLTSNWQTNIGDILKTLLPAGSISGTPKKSTLNIIQKVENFNREFYTGIFGIFDGKKLSSSVMIRFIEKENNQLYYKSGGGITIDSDVQQEYQELIDKVYLPF